MKPKQSTLIPTKRTIALLLSLCIAGISLFLLFSTQGPPKQDLKKQTFSHITKIRNQKKQEVVDYFAHISKQAQSISTDQQMLSFFKSIQKKRNDPDLEFETDSHYVSTYGNFYDILFIDTSGTIFHSIKKEADYGKNIFTSKLAGGTLSKSLKKPSGDNFVEYAYYPPSDEAAAFFSIALTNGTEHIGWFVLQFETNNLNAILTDRKGLGRTGEIYLVNKDKLMLSESRFIADSTILQQKVDTVAVKEALLSRPGEKIINDYRGVNVFSSFEMFNLFGASWVILVEIDENEVITEYFKDNSDYFVQEFIAYLEAQKQTATPLQMPTELRRKKVEMNEFAKAEGDSYLTTEGVATCTAIAISYPGKFAYLAHISPTDEIYINSSFTRYFLGKNYHQFLSELIGKIKYFEIRPYEIDRLQFVIIATHSDILTKAIQVILDHDIELANIKFMYNPKAQSANILLAPQEFNTQVTWNGKKQLPRKATQVEDLGSIVKKLIHYDA